MLKFMKPQSKVVSPERLQKQKELFGCSESCFHGFPTRPSAIAWDPKLSLLALATKNGILRIYGQPGVEFYAQQENADIAITKLCFLPGQGALVTLCSDNSLHLWKIKDESGHGVLKNIKSASLEGKLKRISTIVVDADCDHLLVGTEGGNIYLLDLASFTMTNDIIYQDVVMQNVPENYKVNPGPVEVIAPHPLLSSKILIGYQRGLIVLWDRKQPCAEQTYISSQQLESLCWNAEATEFVSSHNDGSHAIWSVLDSSQCKEGPNTVYGPFPCKPVNKIVWHHDINGSFLIFSGGMARANYGDRNTVTAIQGDNHVTFNLASKVVDFLVTHNPDTDEILALIILTEEEIIFVDLVTEGWPTFQNPYLSSLHASAITCSTFVSNVNKSIFDKIKNAGSKAQSGVSSRSWPISGGKSLSPAPSQLDILVTGHEDGTVRFWDASGICLTLLYKLSTASLFLSDDLGGDGGNAEEEDWPPFRKVGLFDPYSDDPRLGIKKLEMCSHTGQLVVAGTAGQIIVLEVSDEVKDITPQFVDVNLVAENDTFVWKSHSKLDPQTSSVAFNEGFHPLVVIQFYPPAACTSLNLHSEWGLVAAGTAHGFCLFDFLMKKSLLAKSTLSALDIANTADEGPMSRRKSLKKSLRESFRRLRKGRSQRKPTPRAKETPTTTSPKPQPVKISAATEEDGVKPVERAIESRTHSADYIGSMVRCLCLTKCYIANSHNMSATLWAGTNSGAIFVFAIFIPPSEKRLETPLNVQLGKEIHLKHGAPVINIVILDGVGNPFPEPMAVKRGTSQQPDTSGPHKVLISSEEQLKIFTLPQLKHSNKFKLTAREGSRMRRLGTSEFVSTADKSYSETCFLVGTNTGDIAAYLLPSLLRQSHMQCIRREDIAGINSLVFTKKGEALYLISASELARVSLSAKHITAPSCTIAPYNTASTTVTMATKEPTPTPEVPMEVESEKGEVAPDKTEEAVCVTPVQVSPLKKLEEIKENGDNSVLSGDVTIDSIRDHMDELKTSEKVMEIAVTSASTSNALTTTTVNMVKEESSSTVTSSSVTVFKTSTVVSPQDNSSIQVVETTPSDDSPTVNGTEP